jgi:hypothetical protein
MYAETQLVEGLRYKLEGEGFDSRWCHWNFSYIYSFRLHCDLRIDSTPDRNGDMKYFLEVKAAGALSWQFYHLHVPTVLN